MTKYISLSVFLFLMFSRGVWAQDYPYVLGYTAGQNVIADSTGPNPSDSSFRVSFSGGAPFATQWQPLLKIANDSLPVLSGFRFDIVYAENAFDADLFASKGYYGDYVELRWDLINYASQVTNFRVYRKEVGSSAEPVQVANLPSTARSWQDQYAESGTMYEYTLLAEGISNFRKIYLNQIKGIGFRIPYGRVSGRVTYEGGSAVPGVSVIAETQDAFSGSSLYLDGTNAYLQVNPGSNNAKFDLQNNFTFQTWFKPVGTGGGTVFQKGNQYKISYTPGRIFFEAGTDTASISFVQKVDTFFNVTAIKRDTSLSLYIIYNEGDYKKVTRASSAPTTSDGEAVVIGRSADSTNYLKGYLDEIRIWKRAFAEEDIIPMTTRYIEGTENNLIAYYRLDESVGDDFYDLSRKGFAFNEHHGFKSNSSIWDSVNVPLINQLSVKGITDASGNYIISGIPYSTTGSIYSFTPSYQIHSFNPSNQILFIGPGAATHNNINFLDVASFTVTGYVYYDSTNFPVEGAVVKIDGEAAINSNGSPIATSSNGFYSVDVPIGKHFIELEKAGHGIKYLGFNRFPNDTGFMDFQAPLNLPDFRDTTLVKVIGKVVGGPVEASKPAGLGRTVNNIGQATLLLGTQKNHVLYAYPNLDLSTPPPVQPTVAIKTYDNEYYSDTNGLTRNGVTQAKIGGSNGMRRIEIQPDPTTGEFIAYLLPERYEVQEVKAGNYPDQTALHGTIDLTNVFQIKKEVDSTYDREVITPLGVDSLYTYDSINYNWNEDFILRVTPDVSVTAANDSVDFWESTITNKDDSTITVIDSVTRMPLTQWPIFLQRKRYELKISVFESYFNDLTNVTDKVPVTDGLVDITNLLSTTRTRQSYSIDQNGEVQYVFTAGLPNIVTPFTKSMTITARTGKGGSIPTPWVFNNGSYSGPFNGYVFGGLGSGNNFVTNGPNQIDMVIRDPYGSESYAWFDQGSSVSKTSSYSVLDASTLSADFTASLGSSLTTFVGLGAGVITTSEVILDANIGMEISNTSVNNSTVSSTITSSQTWQTSNGPDFVGADGDVFIGHSTNIVYGIAEVLDLIDSSDCPGTDCDTTLVGNKYQIGIHRGLRVNPEFGTAFQFTQGHIQNELIPNLIELRNIWLQNALSSTDTIMRYSTEPGHTLGTAGFGAPNDIKTVNDTSYFDNVVSNKVVFERKGSSYSFVIDSAYFGDTTRFKYGFVDTVKFYNRQIRGWEKILRDNEEEKVKASQLENLSFSAGVTYTSTETYDSTIAKTSNYEFTIAPSVGTKIGFEVLGVGTETVLSETYTNTKTEENGTSTTNTVTFGFELADSDVGDYLSMDVKQPISHSGPVFSNRGGQTRCPYIGAQKTVYYQPGTSISQATVQREIPAIGATTTTQINVPESKPANFQVQLSNQSQTNDDAWFQISVDDTTNQEGARLTMDGTEISNGLLVFVPANQTVNKIISIEKGPNTFNHEDIGIILSSDCESSVDARISLTARFQPVCSDIGISDPLDLWVNNTLRQQDSLMVVIDGYDVGDQKFESIIFQYKPTSSSSWISEQRWLLDSLDPGRTASDSILDLASPNLVYQWNMSALNDRTYDIRAITTCSGTPNNSSEVLKGIKDRKRPQVFGTPQPGDGILSPGEDVMITFDETIEAGLLVSRNFSVTGKLNGGDISHGSYLYFDGVDDYASTLAGVNLSNKSFSIEFWTKRSALSQGVIFHQSQIQLGFTGNSEFYVKLGSDSAVTSHIYNFTDKWIHLTVAYDATANTVNIYSAYDGQPPGSGIVMQNPNFNGGFVGDGRMYIGTNSAKTKPYNGLLHDLRIWEKVISNGTSVALFDKELIGDEIGLSGFWPMDELSGSFATDEARSHHAILHGAAWGALPSGSSRKFNGSSSLSIPTATSLIITEEMDFTIEFWFKGTSQTNTVMFSNGKGDGTEPASAFGDIWNIGFNGTGQLYAKNNGVTIVDPNSNYLDDEWHHLALVLRRKGNTRLFVDGSQKAFASSANFGGLFSNNMAIGSNRHIINGAPYADYFTGNIDEFRAWNLARTLELINEDMHHRVLGSEVGLVAYYPFEKYDASSTVQNTLYDQDLTGIRDTSAGYLATEIGTGGAFDNTDVPLMTLARPVQLLNFNEVVNKDRININLLDAPNLLEKQLVTITVQGVEDLNENVMASPETWTAFIRRNTVLWDQQSLSFVKKQYDTLSFNVRIANSGGLPQNYAITNLPSWLTASSTNGSISPLTNTTIRFTVDPSVNIGTYEEVVYLTSDFGYSEPLLINLKVQGDEPNWKLIPANFQYSMNVFGSIRVDGIISNDPDDKLVAVVNDTVRGIASLNYIPAYDSYLAYLDIYSNVAGGEVVDFYVWDASKGKVHQDVTPSISFQSNSLKGTPLQPVIFDATNIFYDPIPLAKGWNWISFHLSSPLQSNTDALLQSLNTSSGDLIKGLANYDQYSDSLGWTGTITANGGVKNVEMYKFNISNVDTLEYSGSKVDPSLNPIPIDTGWNWIGFISQSNMNLGNAFTNYRPAHGDLIKGQLSFAIYDSILGWVGNLNFLRPKSGYMYHSSKTDTLIYPDSDLFNLKSGFLDNQQQLNNSLALNQHRYQYNMNLVATADLCAEAPEGSYLLVAYSGNEIRGVTASQAQNFYQTIYGNGYPDELTFMIFDEFGNKYHMTEKLVFRPNVVEGQPNSPLELNPVENAFYECEDYVAASINTGDKSVAVYPTMFNDLLHIDYVMQEEGIISIELTDITGKQVRTLVERFSEKGPGRYEWQSTDADNLLAAGVYLIKVKLGDNPVYVQKIIKTHL